MQPTPGDVHVNQPLTNISIAMIQSAAAFIASRVFPNIPVGKQSDRYYTYDRGMFNRDEMELRAPGAESSGGGFTVDNTPSYYCPNYSFHHDIPDEVRANADAVLNPDREAVSFVTQKALIKREKLWVAAYLAGSVWGGTDQTGVASTPGANQFLQWNDANSDPIGVVKAQKTAILESTGFEPNKLVLGRRVWDALADHPDIIDRVKYGQTPGSPAMVTRQAVAALMEIEEIVVAQAIENTAKEGQTNSHSFIAGKKALLVYAAPAPGLMTPSGGYTFSWTGLLGSGAEGNRIRQFRLERNRSDRVEIDMSWATKLVAADLGRYFASVVA